MRLEFRYGTEDIVFDVIKEKRKTIKIAIQPPGIITVTAPSGLSSTRIIELVKTRSSWIMKKLEHLKDIDYIPAKREFREGETFMYLGENYPLQLRLVPGIKIPQVYLYQKKFIIVSADGDKESIRGALEVWYRARGREVIEERVRYYSRFFDISPRNIRVKEQKRIWGSCTAKNDLLFNWRCIMAAPEALDYIIVHEMCHMRHKNHSKDYWNFVGSIMPDYKKRQEWLKKNGVRMEL